MFLKTREKMGILLLACLLVLGTIPFALGATDKDSQSYQNDAWIDSVSSNVGVITEDAKNAFAAEKKDDYDSLSIYGDKIATDSQAAIDTSNSYEVSSDLQSVKDEYNLAMEQARQMGIYISKAAEEAKNGNLKDARSDYEKALVEYGNSYAEHRESVLNQLIVYVTLRHEGRMRAINSMDPDHEYIYHY